LTNNSLTWEERKLMWHSFFCIIYISSTSITSKTEKYRVKQIREMEEETDRVTLHGMWASSYSKRVEMALKIKGMPYEDVEED